MHAAILRYFVEVAKTSSIRRAAETLHVASSAVNRQILKLEQEIGAPLFERQSSGVRLTAAGEVLLQHAKDTLGGFERMRAEIAGLAGTVTGMSASPASNRCSCASFRMWSPSSPWRTRNCR